MSFPKNFVWGAATSAYQIEGAAAEGGRGKSVWDEFCRVPGRVAGGHDGGVACDHYHRYPGDIALMQSLGIRSYRFSVAWPRILPSGRGKANPAGLAFYDRLVDALLEARIDPWVTLFHWDFPQALYRKGGWLHPDSPQWFADYTKVVVDRLSDRVSRWITFNEPQCFVGLGHHSGSHAPGDKLPFDQTLLVTHRVLLAHGLSVQTIRSRAKLRPSIGLAPTADIPVPMTERRQDVAAAREMFWRVAPNSVWNMAWWMEPVIHGRYPESGLKAYGADVPAHTEAELRTISQPLDFLGLNIYNGFVCKRGPAGTVVTLPRAQGCAQAQNQWYVTPAALRWGPVFVYEQCKLPLVITESGVATHDWVSLDGRVHDPQRIDYLARYLAQLGRAIDDGVPALGYFAWSLLDNFEWAEGYRYRFGLVHVDYATQKRTLKDSAEWYRELIRRNGAAISPGPSL